MSFTLSRVAENVQWQRISLSVTIWRFNAQEAYNYFHYRGHPILTTKALARNVCHMISY